MNISNTDNTFATVKTGGVSQSKENDANGDVAFDNVDFTVLDAGVDVDHPNYYYYVIKEVNDGQPGIAYDDTEYKVTVSVYDNGNGTLTVNKTVVPSTAPAGYDAEFTNTEPKEVELEITKNVTGTTADDKDFTFVVTLTGEGMEAKTYNAVKTDKAGQEMDTTIAVSADGSGFKTADIVLKAGEKFKITGLPAGVTYAVNETNLPGGYTPGTHENASGTIAAGSATATMNNIYDAHGPATFKGTKFIENRHFKAGDKFTVKVVGTDNAPMPGSTAAGAEYTKEFTLTADDVAGNATSFAYTLDDINYSLSDIPTGEASKTFTYTVTESAQTMDGVADVDSTSYEVTVTISDKGDGELNVVKSNNAEALNFTNTYDLKPFSFHKKWTDGVSDTAREWPKDASGNKLQITVKLVGELKDDEDRQIDTVIVEGIVLNPAELQPSKTIDITIGGVERTVTISLTETNEPVDYVVTFSGLSKTGTGTGEHVGKTGEWFYYVTEMQVPGYQVPQYPHEPGVERAYNDETITNARIVYELPHTGGAGTTAFYAGGASLMFLAVIAFVWQQKKRYHLIGD